MAVLIDMDMPERCDCCRFRWFTEDVPECAAMWPEKGLDGIDRPSWCPLVEIPKTKLPMTDKELEECNFEL